MDRCALFVDASYALADGALAVHGTRNRDSVSWDYAGLLKLLGSLSRDRTGLPLLRCYWYDTAADGDRAAEHDTLADIPGVKLRLSKARPSRKEGVEAEIRKDLTALARNHAVSDVVIVSAEEDLAPVIAEVQDLGIRTILLHVATDDNWAVARSLRQECDDLIEIASGHLRPYVDLISGAEPQLGNTGYRDLTASANQPGGPQPAIEAPGVRLYASPVVAEYQHAGQLVGQVASGHGEVLNSGPIQRSADGQQLQTAGLSQAQAAQAQAQQAQMAQPQMAQPQMAQPQAAQPPQAQPGQMQPGQMQTGQMQQYQPSDVGRAQAATSGEVEFSQGGFAGQDSLRSPNGQHGRLQETAFGQHSGGEDGRGQPGSLPGMTGVGQPGVQGQNGPGQNGVRQSGVSQDGSGQNGAGQNGLAQNAPAPNGQVGMPAPMSNGPAGGQHGGGQHGGGQYGGFGPQGGVGQPGVAGQSSAGQHGAGQHGAGQHGAGQHGAGQYGAGQQGQQGQHGLALPGNRPPPNGLQAPGMPAHALPGGQAGSVQGQGPAMQTNGLQSSGMQPGGLSSMAMPSSGIPGNQGGSLPSNGVANGLGGGGQGGMPMGGQQPNGVQNQLGGQQPGMPMQGGQQGPAQPGQGPQGTGPGPGQPAPGQQGMQQQQRPASPVMPPNGMMPPDALRSPMPLRQLPGGNSAQYPQDRSMPYSGQVQPAQFSGPIGSTGYSPSPYGGQPPAAPPPVAMSVGEAVQSAHAEGFGFGEAVARDAPALWLEAVLARKPRMPSDLEARLLQGSALPIDSLLHDEVRHALRRGFWDALERSRH